ncbi:MAG: spoIIIJ-associated protein [Kosmotogales bacterium]|nr:spoIIIJ-associated protein [Kosmotogales bacterium]
MIMKTVEVSGNSLKEAVNNACKSLDATEEEVDIKIIDEGSKGFFGIFGSKNAVVNATLKPKHYERKILDFLNTISENFGSEVVFEVSMRNRTFHVTINGDNISRLIGRHGKTVAALEHILNIYANRLTDVKVNVKVDIGGYKDDRKEIIEHIAHKAAKNSLSNNEKIVLEPMFSYERRIVHEVITKYKNLKSYSIGLEPYRKVVIDIVNKKYDKPKRNHNSRSQFQKSEKMNYNRNKD